MSYHEIVDHWLFDLSAGLNHRPEAERKRIVARMRDRVEDLLERGFGVEQALNRFGQPQDYARRVAARPLSDAISRILKTLSSPFA